jgi:hypothetical protein
MKRRRNIWMVVYLVAIAGCSKGGGGADVDSQHVRGMSVMYGQYLTEHRGAPPQDEQEFRTFLASKESTLDQLDLSVDDMFVSPRNGAPIAWFFSKKPVTGPSGMSYIAYEKEPVNGKRFMIATRDMYEEIDEAEFQKLIASAS